MKRIYEGLDILLRYTPGGNATAEQAIFYAEGPPAEDMDPEDVKRLVELGWFIEDRVRWAYFT